MNACRYLCLFALPQLLCGVGVAAAATDGTFSMNAPGDTVDMLLGDMEYWSKATVVGNGGVMSFASINVPHINQNISGLTLSGIILNSAYHNSSASNVKFDGSDITLTGAAFLDNDYVGSKYPRLDLTLKGTGENSLVKTGVGTVSILKPLESFGRVILREGSVNAAENSSGNVLVDSSVGKVAFGRCELAVNSPSSTAMKFPAALDGDVSGGLLPLGDKATNTFSKLDFSAGATLVVTNAGGMANLGTTERLLFTTAPTMTDGILDPRLVTRDPTVTGAPFSFVKYDAEKGVVPFPDSSLVDLASAGEHDVAVVSPASAAADVALAEDRHVAALVVSNRANLVIAEGKTLSVGDGVHPAGVIFQEQENVTGQIMDNYSQFGKEKTATGTLDFGTSHGVIWKGNPVSGESGRGIDIWTTVSGSAGVTFTSCDMGRTGSRYTMYRLRTAAGWTGPTYVQNARLWLHGSDNLPSGGDVWLIGRESYGSVEMFSGSPLTLNQHFHLYGTATESSGMLCNNQKMVFTGSISLEGDVTVCSGDDANDSITFDCPIDGRGRMTISGYGTVRWNGQSPEWSAGLTHNSSYPFVLGPYGDFGAAPFTTLYAANVCTVENHSPAAFSNDWALAGTLKLDHSDVAFDGTVTAGSGMFDTDTVSNLCSTVSLGGKASFASLKVSGTRDDTTFTASEGRAGTLCVNPSASCSCAFGAGRTDGSGKLSFVKEGAGTATLLPTHGAVTHSGETRIEAGTLKLGCDPLSSPSLVWHLDATREDSLTFDADTKAVSEWRSLVGNATFRPYYSAKTPYYTNTVNGLKVITFDRQKDTTYFVSTNELCQRTVFIACRPSGGKPASNYYTIFGKNGSDYGFRQNDSGQWEGNVSQYKYNTTGTFYCNGEKKTGFASGPSSGAHVLTIIHDRDWLDTGSFVPSKFTVTIGGYSAANGNLVGDIGEVLAYDRVLSDSEREEVENYLCRRWTGSVPHASVVRDETLLSPNSPLVLGYGATLDLNGHDQTVASLSGEGTVTNSSSVAAVLRVTGANSFAGRVGGNVKIVSAGGDMRLDLSGAASLALTGGSAAIGPYNMLPLKENLAYWLDAASGVTTNASGTVTAWASRAPSAVEKFEVRSAKVGPLAVVENAINSLPALSFGKDSGGTSTALQADKITIDRTLFIVGVLTQKSDQNAGIYGMLGCDSGIRLDNGVKLQAFGRVNYYFPEDTMRINGAVQSFSGYSLGQTGTTPFCLTLRLDPDKHPDDELHYGGTTKILQKQSVLGAYGGFPSAYMRIAEAIAYTNTLTDAEMISVEDYLLDKYALGGHVTPAPLSTAFNGTGGLSLSGGAAVSVDGGAALGELRCDGAGGTLAGDWTLDGDFIVDAHDAASILPLAVTGNLAISSDARAYCYNYTNLTRNVMFPALTVSGTVTGGTLDLGEPLEKAWKWVRSSGGQNVWSLGRPLGFMMIFK